MGPGREEGGMSGEESPAWVAGVKRSRGARHRPCLRWEMEVGGRVLAWSGGVDVGRLGGVGPVVEGGGCGAWHRGAPSLCSGPGMGP